jgi:hypothetical protein
MSRVILLTALLVLVAGAARAQLIPPPIIIPTSPPSNLPGLKHPTFTHSTCTMKGPSWVLYSAQAPNGPPRHGNRYRVHAYGLTCKRARHYLRAFFPKIPPHPMGTLKGGPKGYRCVGGDPPGTQTRSEPHDGSCKRRGSAKRFSWRPTGGTVG